ncbi:MAG: AbrB family transcriptional regulator [Ancylobacter novellus]|uniref:AbrB family transcriptional regulator n=1 Tax=Ancylobacter novellus TaxID=921 RepID=A0A2W5KLH2_ANCNO|nr:MAG: AbrB family transcriptional regulator [Ancylobacter novellus]
MKGDDDLATFAMTVTSKGQVTLPAEFRQKAGIETGDRIDLVLQRDGQARIRPRKGRLSDLRGLIKWPHPISDEDLETMIAEARSRRLRR